MVQLCVSIETNPEDNVETEDKIFYNSADFRPISPKTSHHRWNYGEKR